MKNPAEKIHRFYGRRKGKTLRHERRAALETGLPKFQLALPDSGFLDLGSYKEHWLEIGFGTGEVIADFAQRHPDIGFIGAEPFVNGQSALLKTIADNNIQNIRIYPDDARALLPALPDHSITKLFLLFADPWPKTRHIKRRFLQPEILDEFARILIPGGELRLASDDPGLVRWLFDLTWHHPAFEWTARAPKDWRIRPADQALSRYEEKRKSGFAPIYLKFKRKIFTLD